MTSPWAKGAKAEKLYCKRLEDEGFIIRRWIKTRFGSQDLWGCDIIAKKKGETRYIQVKSLQDHIPSFRKKDEESLQMLKALCCQHETVWWVGYNHSGKDWMEIRL